MEVEGCLDCPGGEKTRASLVYAGVQGKKRKTPVPGPPGDNDGVALCPPPPAGPSPPTLLARPHLL